MRAPVYAIPLALLGMVLSGCTAPLTRSAIVSNLVQEDTHNAYLLMNIARARERMPMHFTQLNVVRDNPGALGVFTPGLSWEINVGGDDKVTPSLEVNSGVDTVSLVSQEFMRGMTTPIEPKMLTYFADQGWPLAMLMYLTVGAIEIVDKKGAVISRIDNNPASPTFAAFQGFVKRMHECRLSFSEHKTYTLYGRPVANAALSDLKQLVSAKEAGLSLIPVYGNGETKKIDGKPYTHVQFGSISSEPRLQFLKRPDTKEVKDAGDVKVDLCKLGDAPLFSNTENDVKAEAGEAQAKRFFALYDAVTDFQRRTEAPATDEKAADDKKVDTDPKPVASDYDTNFSLRSTQSMIYYLGEISRAQDPLGGSITTGSKKIYIPVIESPADTANGTASATAAPSTLAHAGTDAPGSGKPAAGSGATANADEDGQNKREAMLFHMSRSVEKDPDAAISVFYRSGHLNVAKHRDTRSGDGDRSAQTLSLLSLIYALHNRSSDAPTTRNVRLIP
jgi:hypothetical protein